MRRFADTEFVMGSHPPPPPNIRCNTISAVPIHLC